MPTPPFPEVDREVLRREFAADTIEPLEKAFGHQCFLLRGGAETRLLKIARLPAEIARLKTTAQAIALARAHGVRTPEVLQVGELPAFGGRAFLVQQFLPGKDAEDAWPALSPERRLALLSDLGQEIGKLHTIRPPCFTEGTPASGQEASWEAHVKDRLEKLVRYNRKAQVLSFEELSRATVRIVGLLSASASHVVPALAHRDLCLRNALVDEAGRFRAILDFEHARYSDALMDFVKLRMWVFEKYPGSEAELMRGYRKSVAAPWPFERERLAIAEGLELLGEIPYFKRNGNEPHSQSRMMEAVARLRDWLTFSSR